MGRKANGRKGKEMEERHSFPLGATTVSLSADCLSELTVIHCHIARRLASLSVLETVTAACSSTGQTVYIWPTLFQCMSGAAVWNSFPDYLRKPTLSHDVFSYDVIVTCFRVTDFYP